MIAYLILGVTFFAVIMIAKKMVDGMYDEKEGDKVRDAWLGEAIKRS